jgi:hypothetical protein
MQAIGFGIMAYGAGIFWCMMLLFTSDSNGLPAAITVMFVPFAGRIKCITSILTGMKEKVSVCYSFIKKYWDKIRRDRKLMAGNKKVEYAPEMEVIFSPYYL